MPTVGSSTFKVSKKYENMDQVCEAIYGFTNNSRVWVAHRVAELNGVRKKRGYELDKDMEGELGDTSLIPNVQLDNEGPKWADIRNKSLIGAAMQVLSRQPDKKMKAIALVYLMTETPLYIKYPDEFHLDDNFETEYTYILDQNRELNEGIKKAAELTSDNEEAFRELKAELRAHVDEDIATEILRYEPSDYLKISTGNFYKVLKKRIGERFNTIQKEYVGEFLRKYKELLKNNNKGKQALFCKCFGLQMSEYNRESKAKAIQPISDACLVSSDD